VKDFRKIVRVIHRPFQREHQNDLEELSLITLIEQLCALDLRRRTLSQRIWNSDADKGRCVPDENSPLMVCGEIFSCLEAASNRIISKFTIVAQSRFSLPSP
jgi:hypothetical protein